jgi:hypothetical protein
MTKRLNPTDLYKLLLPKTTKNKKELEELYKIPPKESKDDAPSFINYQPYHSEQMDTLYLPTDAFGYKYLLVVVDICTRRCDAEPMKNHDGNAVVKAIDKMYSRDIIKKPIKLYADNGTEFNNTIVKQYCNDNNIFLQFGHVNRHRQMALAEYKNKIIGSNLFKLMADKEISTGLTSKSWMKFIKQLIDLINDNLKPFTPPKNDDIKLTKNNNTFIPEGTLVRTQLDYPIDVATGKRLISGSGSTGFRSGDIRWSKKIEPIEHVFIRPNQPIMYSVKGEHNILHTSQQLQQIKFV